MNWKKTPNKPWETDDYINDYLQKRQQQRDKLAGAGVIINDQQMVMKFVKNCFHVVTLMKSTLLHGNASH